MPLILNGTKYVGAYQGGQKINGYFYGNKLFNYLNLKTVTFISYFQTLEDYGSISMESAIKRYPRINKCLEDIPNKNAYTQFTTKTSKAVLTPKDIENIIIRESGATYLAFNGSPFSDNIIFYMKHNHKITQNCTIYVYYYQPS